MKQVEGAMKIALIAAETSGDQLGAGLIAALRERVPDLEVVGVGGEAMASKGLNSLFDYEYLSIIGASAAVKRAPMIYRRIHQTVHHVLSEKPDALIIIDSPGFTHRVARRVRSKMPDLPIINYVCPTVWAWKPGRASRMTAYVDHVLSVFPFEPAIVRDLDGPAISYIGHPLASSPDLLAACRAQQERRKSADIDAARRTILVLPGSRSSEIMRLMPVFKKVLIALKARHPDMHFVLPAVPRHAGRIHEMADTWPVRPEIVIGTQEKWRAFAGADAAMAASGTVLLELALTGVPCVSVYKLDALARLLSWQITTWSAALPNLIADYPVIPEYVNETVRPERIVRWIERLSVQTPQRQAMLVGFDTVRDAMRTDRSPNEAAADIVLTEITTNRHR